MKCVLCDRTSDEIPVIGFVYRGQEYHVCTGHLPALLHKPEMFAGKLPDADGEWRGEEDHHHD
jgi:hypothetical protein